MFYDIKMVIEGESFIYYGYLLGMDQIKIHGAKLQKLFNLTSNVNFDTSIFKNERKNKTNMTYL